MAKKHSNKPMNRKEFSAMVNATRRKSDDFVNATEWCKLYGKDWRDFLKDAKRREYVTAVATRLNVPRKDIMETKRGKGGSTSVHPLVFLELIRWLDADIAVFANEVFQKYIEGDADLGLEIMLRDHNKGRLERAKSRLRVVDANKQVSELAVKEGVRPDQVHNDRYRGLYLLTCGQLRAEAKSQGIEDLRDDETPLNVMSTYDLAINELANLMALRSENPNAIFSCASDLRQVHEKQTGKRLTPEWKDNRMQPSKARRLLNSPQLELPV